MTSLPHHASEETDQDLSLSAQERAAMCKVIGARLRLVRELAGISQARAARILNIDQGTLSRYENGHALASSDVLLGVAKFSRTPVDRILAPNVGGSRARKARKRGRRNASDPEDTQAAG